MVAMADKDAFFSPPPVKRGKVGTGQQQEHQIAEEAAFIAAFAAAAAARVAAVAAAAEARVAVVAAAADARAARNRSDDSRAWVKQGPTKSGPGSLRGRMIE